MVLLKESLGLLNKMVEYISEDKNIDLSKIKQNMHQLQLYIQNK